MPDSSQRNYTQKVFAVYTEDLTEYISWNHITLLRSLFSEIMYVAERSDLIENRFLN